MDQEGITHASPESALPLAVVIVDEAGRVQWANDKAQELAGRKGEGQRPSALWSAFLTCILSREDGGESCGKQTTCLRCGIREAADRALETGDTVPFHLVDLPLVGDTVTVPLLFAASPVEYKGRTAVRVMFTEFRVAAPDIEAVLRQRTRLEREKAKESLRRFAGGIAHVMNNHLTAILGAGEFMEKLLEGEEATRRWHQVRRAARSCAQLGSQLLTISSKRPHRRERVQLGDVVDASKAMLATLCHPRVRVDVPVALSSVTVLGDPEQLVQLITNLGVNACEAMREGGIVTLRVETRELNSADITSHLEARPGRFAVISVQDVGQGFTDDEMRRLFHPYGVFPERGGLDLAAVDGIAHAHGGWVQVKSELGSGTTISCYLPLAPDGSDTEKRPSSTVRAALNEQRHVLIVEDEPSILELVREVVEGLGFQVLGTATAAEARRVFREAAGHLRLALLDVVLPDGNGLQLAHEFRDARPELPVVLTSGYPDTFVREGGDEHASFPFLQKPFTLQQLVEIIDSALAGELESDQLI